MTHDKVDIGAVNTKSKHRWHGEENEQRCLVILRTFICQSYSLFHGFLLILHQTCAESKIGIRPKGGEQ